MNRYKNIGMFVVVVTFVIYIKLNSITAFSSSITGELDMNNLIQGDKNNTSDHNIIKNGGVDLEGMIGDWDPNEGGISEKLDGLKESEVTGVRPKDGEYFTIAATVPVNMEFGVYRNSTNVVMGYFFSPKYRITNNGSKELNVKLGFEKGTEVNPEKTLFVDKPKRGNGKVEIDLSLSYTKNNVEQKVDLTENLIDKSKWKELGRLSSNEEALVTFKADSWEPVAWEATVRNSVEFSGKLMFEFSY